MNYKNVSIDRDVPIAIRTSRTPRTFHKSFGLVEVVIAVGIFVVFAASIITVIVLSSKNMVVNKHRLQAANLAREGIEIVTEIRDTAWQMSGPDRPGWDLIWGSGTSSSCWGLGISNPRKIIDHPGNPSSLSGCPTFPHKALGPGTDNISQNNVTFTRSFITEDYEGDLNIKKITVTVHWDDNGQGHDVIMSTLLTNWK